MSDDADLHVERRGRKRDPRLDDRILTAAIEQYAEAGWSGFGIEGVAKRAGVGKSSVYLRWGDKVDLLMSAVSRRVLSLDDVDTGSLHGDLALAAEHLLSYYLDPIGWATLRLAVDVAGGSADLPGFSETVVPLIRGSFDRVVERAKARGELAPDASVDWLAESLFGAVTMRVISTPPAERAELQTPPLRAELAQSLATFITPRSGRDR